MELRQLRYFVTLANTLHFTRAAEELKITQPALSLQIRSLEGELGVELFRRTRRDVHLTDAGAVFLERATAVLAEAERATVLARQAQRGETGELAISFAPDLAVELLPQIIKAFRRRWPKVRLTLRELWSAEQAEALHARQVHVALLHPPIDDAGLVTRSLFRQRSVLALPARHPLTKKRKIALRDLESEDWLRLVRPPTNDPLRRVQREGGFEPRVVQEAAQIHTLLGLVAAGMGICVVPGSLQKLQIRGVTYRPFAGAADMETAVAWRADADQPTVRAFVEVLGEVLGKPVS